MTIVFYLPLVKCKLVIPYSGYRSKGCFVKHKQTSYVPSYSLTLDYRDYSFRAGNTQKGRPVYYVVEEPDSLHSDRSPYTYEPADSRNSFPDAGIEFSHSGKSCLV